MKKENLIKNIVKKIQSPTAGEDNLDKENKNPNQKQIPKNKIVSIKNINQINSVNINKNENQKKDTLTSEEYLDHPKPLESDYYDDDDEKENILEIFNHKKMIKFKQKNEISKVENSISTREKKLKQPNIEIINKQNIKPKISYSNENTNNINNLYIRKEKTKNKISENSSRKFLNHINNKKINYNPVVKFKEDKKKNNINENNSYLNKIKKINEESKQTMNKPIINERIDEIQNIKDNFKKNNFNMNKNKNKSMINENQLIKIINQTTLNKKKEQNTFNSGYNKSKNNEEEINYISYSQQKKSNNEKLFKNITNSQTKSINNLKKNQKLNKNFKLYPRKISYENENENVNHSTQMQNNLLQNKTPYFINRLNNSNKIDKNQIPLFAKSQKFLIVVKSLPETEYNSINKKKESEPNLAKNKIQAFKREGEFNNVKTTCIFYSKKNKPKNIIKINISSELDKNNISQHDFYSNSPNKRSIIDNSILKSNQKQNIMHTELKKKNANPFNITQFNSPNLGKSKYVPRTVINQYKDNHINKSQAIIPIKKHFNCNSNLSERKNSENSLSNYHINNNIKIKSSLHKNKMILINNKTDNSALNYNRKLGSGIEHRNDKTKDLTHNN